MGAQLRDFVLDDVPSDAITDAKVLMSGEISEAADFAPFHKGETLADLIWHILGSLADDFQIAQYGIVCAIILLELFKRKPGRKAQYFGAALLYIFQV